MSDGGKMRLADIVSAVLIGLGLFICVGSLWRLVA